MNTNHALDEVLERYVRRQLQPSEVESLEEHLFVCDSCRQRLDDTETFLAAAKEAAARVDSKGNFFLRPRFDLGRIAKPLFALAATAAITLFFVIPRPGTMTGDVQEAELHVSRGAETKAAATVRANTRLKLRIDVSELPAHRTYRVEIADASGEVVRKQVVQAPAATIDVTVDAPLSPGRYWVRLYSPPDSDELLREFGLDVAQP